ncbi:hypothetical protein V6N13_055549 [Hibiscus sabdariffa]|uniref:Uncharacterized protein n=1 Tax=Hibiscus sabdariffa TaxID=183260 RepID=A0ABR2NUF8_9ROSI
MNSDTSDGESASRETGGKGSWTSSTDKKKEKVRVSQTSIILWHAHRNNAGEPDYGNRTPVHVAPLHGCIDVTTCLLEFGADANAQDLWKNTAKGAKKHYMMGLLRSYDGSSYSGFRHEAKVLVKLRRLSKLIKVQNCHDANKMTGYTEMLEGIMSLMKQLSMLQQDTDLRFVQNHTSLNRESKPSLKFSRARMKDI